MNQIPYSRTHYCGLLSASHATEQVTLMGWVHNRRDLGNLIFLSLRDREGIVQVTVDSESVDAFEMAKQLRSEFVVLVQGKVVHRSPETVNPDMPSGDIEVLADKVIVLNQSDTPPISLSEKVDVSEENRLRYRYLDLRRPQYQRNLKLRHQIALEVRKQLDSEGFLEIETPFLTKSTPEGARDYLVPSRLQEGHFYALPQSPQIFKQILMISGFDRYFQIVRCFRDEDLRADRQPEFTQIDIEMSFVNRELVFTTVESLLAGIFRLIDVEIPIPFPRLSYHQAVERYGTDRPDTRFGLELVDLSSGFETSQFRVFRSILESGGIIKGICLRAGADLSRKQLDQLAAFIKTFGAQALTWIKHLPEGIRSSLPKVVTEPELERICELAGSKAGDILLIVAGQPKVVHDSLAALRSHVAAQRDLIPASWNLVWVQDFPLLEWDDEDARYYSLHHPFTAPLVADLDLLESNPASALAQAYDVVLNGIEIGGGSIRIHQTDVQRKIFQLLGIGDEEAELRFGFFLEALRYGAPPHGGIALGLDRIAMLLAGETSLREVIAFPKTARALDLMSGAPSPVTPEQLKELRLAVRPRPR